MKAIKKSKINLFLLEAVITLALFCLLSTVIIQIFIKANDLRVQSNDLTCATVYAQNIAETFKSSDIIEQGTTSIYYDKHWQVTEQEDDKCYEARLTIVEEQETVGTWFRIDIDMRKGSNQTIYLLETSRYEYNEKQSVMEETP